MLVICTAKSLKHFDKETKVAGSKTDHPFVDGHGCFFWSWIPYVQSLSKKTPGTPLLFINTYNMNKEIDTCR